MEDKLPAGTYFIGDPCYVIPNDDWDRYCDEMFEHVAVFEFDGHKTWVEGTAWGDGVYTDNSGRQYPVDSGTIGAVPISLITGHLSGGHIVTFDKSFTVDYHDGKFTIGDIIIETNLENDDDNDKEWWD